MKERFLDDGTGAFLWEEENPHPRLPSPGEIYVRESQNYRVVTCVQLTALILVRVTVALPPFRKAYAGGKGVSVPREEVDATGSTRRRGSAGNFEELNADVLGNAECPRCHGRSTHKVHGAEVYEFSNFCRDCDKGFDVRRR